MSRVRSETAAVETTLVVLRGRWRALLLAQLLQGPQRFGQLRRDLPGITSKVLSNDLRQLAAAGVLVRECRAAVPPEVEYRLTRHGLALRPVLEEMVEWGTRCEMSRQDSSWPQPSGGGRETAGSARRAEGEGTGERSIG